jgi:enterochelin esterase-like enzyme
MLLSSLLFGFSLGIYANETKNMQPYAVPCEAIQPQSDVLKKLTEKLTTSQDHAQVIQQFWTDINSKHTPIIEKITDDESRLIFLWRGAQHNVRLVGGPSNDHEWLTRLPNTDIWFKESIVKNSYLGSYSFAVDLPNIDGYLSHYCPQLDQNLKESRQQRRSLLQVLALDPSNPQTWFNPDASKSNLRNENLIRLSHAPQAIYLERNINRQAPNLRTIQLKSELLKNERKIQIYQSANPKNIPYVTAIFFDGEEYATLLNTATILDLLVQQGQLTPIQAVFVSAPNAQERPKELTPNAEFSAFFKNEFLPWLDHQIQRDNKKTVVLGSSLGGLSAAYLALENPTQISHVVPMSGSFWWQSSANDLPNGMSKIIRTLPNQPKQQWYVSANSYESSRNNNGLSILETAPIVAADLKQQGHQVVYKSYVGGHSYALWQVILQDALLHFFKAE